MKIPTFNSPAGVLISTDRFFRAISLGEEADRLCDEHVHTCGTQTVDELQMASGIASGDRTRAGGGEMADLALLQDSRGLRLGDVVNAGAAAAPIRLRKFGQLDAGDSAQDFTRLPGDFLAVAEVAGLMVGDFGGRDSARRPLNPPRCGCGDAAWRPSRGRSPCARRRPRIRPRRPDAAGRPFRKQRRAPAARR